MEPFGRTKSAQQFTLNICPQKILLAKFSLKRPFIVIKEPIYSKFC